MVVFRKHINSGIQNEYPNFYVYLGGITANIKNNFHATIKKGIEGHFKEIFCTSLYPFPLSIIKICPLPSPVTVSSKNNQIM